MADDFNSRLNAILSDPSAMRQIMSLASGMMGSDSKSDPSPPGSGAFDPPQNDIQTGSSSSDSAEDKTGGRQSDDGSLPTGLISFSQRGSNDDSCELLRALKPFLRKSRADRIDMMIRVLQISRLAKKR